MLTTDSIAGSVVAIAVLVVVIVVTVSVRRVPPAVLAVPLAGLVLVLGLTTMAAAADELTFMAPTIAFLAAMFVVADVCARTGVFTWVGHVLARRSRGSPTRLLGIVFVAAAVTTAVLSLDTTIVLLTPVAVLTARRVGARVAPVGYASNHLANTASTLFPVSNLTNLLAFSATGLGFLEFTGLMAAPWIVAILVEYLIFRWFFAGQLDVPVVHRRDDADDVAPTPLFSLISLGALLAAFVVAEPVGLPLYAVAWIGAAVMLVESMRRAPFAALRSAARSINIPFLAFVAALGIIILPVREGAVGDAVADLVPSGTGLLTLLGVAVLAAVLANLLNNLPATLLLVPLVADRPGVVLAVLLGVNIGPNLAYFGSLANLLWRDIMHRHTGSPTSRQYLTLGLLTVPATLLTAVVALWVGLSLT
ncbi:SLC13 family permease [Gordonia sp. ABSL49_1]|uniref:SLC13 family permease n=1 Tax=Gordonia sp. ABSL49_1 TaxID=2920941 RepID=UPI001F0FBD99|nr:SLC13 family permease [Gordonia sp. ABSL49_1]MCH5645198.1 arsenic transporter [Gordonia sp. ABSL49_1]